MTTSTSYSFPPADDLLSALATVTDGLRRVDWRYRSLAGVDAVLTAAAVCHALLIRVLPYVAWAAARVATIASAAAAPATIRTAPAAIITFDDAALAVAPLPTLRVTELRSRARQSGIRSVAGRPVKFATRAQLLAALA